MNLFVFVRAGLLAGNIWAGLLAGDRRAGLVAGVRRAGLGERDGQTRLMTGGGVTADVTGLPQSLKSRPLSRASFISSC